MAMDFFNKTENGLNSIGHGGAIDGFRAIECIIQPKIFLSLYCAIAKQTILKDSFKLYPILLQVLKPTMNKKKSNLMEKTLDSYVGTYKNDKHNVSIKIYRANGRIYGDLSKWYWFILNVYGFDRDKLFLARYYKSEKLSLTLLLTMERLQN